MILYFANRKMEIVGSVSTKLPEGFRLLDDNKIEDVETGTTSFECVIGYNKETRAKVEAMTQAGNYLLRSCNNENEFYTVIDFENDRKHQEIRIYAEDAGLDLLNEVVGAYKATEAHTAEWYVNKYISDSGFEIGINEIPSSSTRKLSWEGESTCTARIASIATQFGGFEVSYSFEIKGLQVKKKYINLYQKRGKETGCQLRLNKDVDNIITTQSIADLATALVCTGGTPENSENPITLKGYSYDDGDFYVGSDGVLRSRNAVKKWSRYVWNNEPNQQSNSAGHIWKPYSYDTLSQATLCSHAITDLKKVCDVAINYEVEISKLPDNIKIGDRINIVDNASELYLSTRILQLEYSETQDKHKATLGEHLIKESGISSKVEELAAQFVKTSQSAAKALSISKSASTKSENAESQANTALNNANNAQTTAEAAQEQANNALQSATEAQTKANNASDAVNSVTEKVTGLETTVNNAQLAAENAQEAANTAQTKADEAAQSATTALTEAQTAKESATRAETNSESAIEKAETAQNTANEAKENATLAKTTADAAKADAETAQNEIENLSESLTTLSNTMSADYARKTELTETEANLQSQITQNATEIETTVSRVQTIDETANNAKAQAEAAQTTAEVAQAQANKAVEDAENAQEQANTAKQSADNAQTEANNAKTAAETAQTVAAQAKADLETAKADLTTVSSRVDATEEEITAAKQAVTIAQSAADAAQAEAETATSQAVEAQNKADTAKAEAEAAQTTANNAATTANLAQQLADEAKGNATAAQTKADEAAETAAEAQRTANTAVNNATQAQEQANTALENAQTAQAKADEAQATATQAATDLETAQQNLANVTSRVGATEEEIEAAQQAVETAQAAADTAKAEAEAAQATADTAKTNAALAQTAADNAKNAADNAQAKADEAQAAADEAQADVDSLAVRVTSSETKITQNTNQISLMATKDEVSTTLGGYYTKEETDAAITVKSNEITSNVTSQIEEIQIGGRNLVTISSIQEGNNVISTQSFELRNVWASVFINSNNLAAILQPATEYTIHYDLELIERTTVPTAFDMRAGFLIYREGVWIDVSTYGFSESAEIGDKVSVEHTFTTPDEWNGEQLICYSRRWTTEGASPIGFDAFTVSNLKIEKGNKATDWTPAPEDIEAVANEAQTTANDTQVRITAAESTIQQLSDSISTLVTDSNGVSLMTQTANGWTFSTADIQNTVNQTSELLNDVVNELGSTEATVDILKQAISDIGTKTEYVNISSYTYTDEQGEEKTEPCIELGETDSVYKVLITNTQILFKVGTNTPTRIETDGLVTENITVENELRHTNDNVEGYYYWSMDTNGYIGLQWKGADE